MAGFNSECGKSFPNRPHDALGSEIYSLLGLFTCFVTSSSASSFLGTAPAFRCHPQTSQPVSVPPPSGPINQGVSHSSTLNSTVYHPSSVRGRANFFSACSNFSISGVQVGRPGAQGHPWLHREFEASLDILVCFLLLYKTLTKMNLGKKGLSGLQVMDYLEGIQGRRTQGKGDPAVDHSSRENKTRFRRTLSTWIKLWEL